MRKDYIYLVAIVRITVTGLLAGSCIKLLFYILFFDLSFMDAWNHDASKIYSGSAAVIAIIWTEIARATRIETEKAKDKLENAAMT